MSGDRVTAGGTTDLPGDGETPGRASANSYKPVGAIVAGLAVLRYLASAPTALPLSRITRDVGLNPSTCLNILRTLAAENYVSFDHHSKLYAMGLGALELVSGALAHGGDLGSIRTLTNAIAVAEEATVTLWRRIPPNRILLVMESLPPGNVSIKMNVGQRLPLLIGAAGRLMAAHTALTDDELRQQYRTLRLERPMTFREFQAQAKESAERGWAIDHGHFSVGTSSVAVPVLDGHGEAVFAITATVFTAKFSMEWAERLAVELKEPATLLAAAQPYL